MRIVIRYLLSLIPLVVCSISAFIYAYLMSPEGRNPNFMAAVSNEGLARFCLLVGLIGTVVWIASIVIQDTMVGIDKKLEERSMRKHTGHNPDK